MKNKVIVITGGSRGIGREIALKCASQGASVAILAKTAEPHPILEGTIYTVSEEIKQAGGRALPIQVDVRDEAHVERAMRLIENEFGRIDVLVNNASAIDMSPTLTLEMKKFDLMFSVNVRATFLCSKLAHPLLKKGEHPHIVNLSPPLHMKSKWFEKHVAYTMSKYGMSMCTLGMADEFKPDHIAVNSLWPKTIIKTAAIERNFPKSFYEATRLPSIVADAFLLLVKQNNLEITGQFLIDEDFLRERGGVTDFASYAAFPGTRLMPDLFLDGT